MAGTMWSTDRGSDAPEAAQPIRLVQAPVPPPVSSPVPPRDESLPFEEDLPAEPPPIEEMQVVVAQNAPPPGATEEMEGPPPIPQQPENEGIISEEDQGSFGTANAGGDMASGAALIVES